MKAFFNLLIFIFKIFGYAGFSLLYVGFSLAVVCGLLITVASLVAKHGL